MFKLNTSGFKIRGGRYYQSILFTNEEKLHNANSRDLSLQDRYKSNNASVLNNFHLFYRLCDDAGTFTGIGPTQDSGLIIGLYYIIIY